MFHPALPSAPPAAVNSDGTIHQSAGCGSHTQAASDGSVAALLGLAGPYLALTTSYRSDLGTLSCMLVLDPTVNAVGLPLGAAGPVPWRG